LARSLDAVIVELKSALSADCPGDSQAASVRLSELCEELKHANPAGRAESLFLLLEAYAESSHEKLNVLVRALEQFDDLEIELGNSIRRKPVQATVRMVGRELNRTPDSEKRASWIHLLTNADQMTDLGIAVRSELKGLLSAHREKQKDVIALWQIMTPEIKPKPRKPGMSSSLAAGILCTLLGAFGGCSLQFEHDVGGSRDYANYLLSGIGFGLLVGLAMGVLIRFFDRDA